MQLFAQEIEPTPEKCKSLREQAKKALEVKLQGVLEGSADLEPKAKERIAGQFKEFRALFGNFLDGGSSKIEWNKIKDLPSESVIFLTFANESPNSLAEFRFISLDH